MDTQATAILKDKFGYDDFRPGQATAITRVLNGDNTLVLMPTGGGKSLCYQVPALMLPGLTVVVSPLIALMKDQVDALNENGIAATFINSTITYGEMNHRLDLAAQGEAKLLYLAPERLDNPDFVQQLGQLNISMQAIDEAHCISQWGHDFRPSYLNLQTIAGQLPSHPVVIALTATATHRVATDICDRLAIPAGGVVSTGFARDNLSFQVVRDQDKDTYLLEYLKLNPDHSGIIYCSTRKEVERLSSLLAKHHYGVAHYHGGMSDTDRAANQEDFLFDRKPIMVATNAFGMGIDKSNVRFVIHAQAPGDLESYYQEAGRAGRDGLPSDAILLFAPKDLQIQRFFIDQSDGDDDYRQKLYSKLETMRQYGNTGDCLQQFILRYFGEASAPCGRCSNCKDDRVAADVTTDAQKVLSCVVRMRSRFGKGMVMAVLAGAHNQKVKTARLEDLPTFGLLSSWRQKDITGFIDFLTAAGYLQPAEGQFPTLHVTATGAQVLRGELKVTRKQAATARRSLPVDNDLFQQLRELRTELAETNGVPPYVIFSDQTLRDLASTKPQDRVAMLSIKGIGQNKLDKYGDDFLQILQAAD